MTMTEVQLFESPVSFSGASSKVRSIKHYEAKPPTNLSSNMVDSENVLATTKEEEWVTKKKVELTTKKQIETRVKRQVVLEDGKVVEDSGPVVTTNTTEDTEKQEHQHTEHRQIGGDDKNETEGWVAVPSSTGLMKNIQENKVKSREETEERLETEAVQHLGDITDDAYLKAIQSQRKDLRLALRQASSQMLSTMSPSNERIVHHSLKNRKTVDKEDTKHSSQVQDDGKLITETRTTTEHEDVKNTAEPDDSGESGEEDYETRERSSQRYRKTKEQELVEYIADGVKVGEQVRFEAENVEGDRQGNADALKMLAQPLQWESLSERVRRMRKEKQLKLEADRTDALTKKPLNFDQEERTRKVETSKWLEHHFGSESRSSKSSLDGDVEVEGDGQGSAKKSTSSFINVTMKSTKSARRPLSPVAAAAAADVNRSQSQLVDNGTDSASAKNVYEIQTGSIKKVHSRPFSPFRPIEENAYTQSSKLYASERVSTPPLPSEAPSKLLVQSSTSTSTSPPLYASVKQKYRHQHHQSQQQDATTETTSTTSFNRATPVATDLQTLPGGNSRAWSPLQHKHNSNGIGKIETAISQPQRKSTLVGRNFLSQNKSWSRSERRLTDISDSDVQKEPDPDYTPRLRKKVSSTPDVRSSSPLPSAQRQPDTTKKKIYQKTRFAADMPMVKRSKSTNRSERKSGIGETFRKIMSKFHNNKEGVEKKGKNWRNDSSSSPPPPPSSSAAAVAPSSSSSISKNYGAGAGGYYQTFGNVDNHIDAATTTVTNDSSSEDVGENVMYAKTAVEKKSGRESPLPKQAAKRFYSSEESSNNANAIVSKKRVTATPAPALAPPPASSSLVRRSSTLTTGKSNSSSNTNANANGNINTASYASQTLDRNYRVKKKQQQQQQDDSNMFKRRSPVQKYYLGEDPFGGSIYGREKEYDAAATKPFRRKHKSANANDEEKKSVRSHILNGMNNIFGGRLGRSISSKLPNSNSNSDSNQKSKKVHIDYTNRGGIQTLPRKSKKQVYINDPSSDQENLHSRKSLNRNANSMINVSVINGGGGGRTSAYKSSPDILGPEKPARTYRTSLLRSKSFNVQLGPYGYERSPSPGFAFKSNPQLHKLEESQAPLKSPGIVTSISRSTRDLSKAADDHRNNNNNEDDDYFDAAADFSKINGYSTYDNSSSTRRRIFLKGLKHRAPELYKTLHEDDEFDLYSRSKNGGGGGTNASSPSYRPKHRQLEYSNSFHSGTSPSYRKSTVSFESDRRSPTTTTIGRPLVATDSIRNGGVAVGNGNGNNSDGYSETVRITSKSNDPVRPSVTNTVQSFSKKTIPSKDGRLETIESSETTRVTKSHYRGNDAAAAADSDSSRYEYSTRKNGGGGVVIEVRNDRK